MGSASSKVGKTAAVAAKRKYPQRVPPSSSNTAYAPSPPAGQPAAPGPAVHPQPQASDAKDESISLDASDPDFARSLRALGPVQPSSTLSNSSTFNPVPSTHVQGSRVSPSYQIFPDPSQNPAILVVRARERLQNEAEAEFARSAREEAGRSFLDVSTIRQILMMRDEQGRSDRDIEKSLGLKDGVVRALGPKGVLGDVRVGKTTAEDSRLYG